MPLVHLLIAALTLQVETSTAQWHHVERLFSYDSIPKHNLAAGVCICMYVCVCVCVCVYSVSQWPAGQPAS